MPEFLQVGFETKERVEGSAAVLFGVVADSGKLEFSIDGEYDRMSDTPRRAGGLMTGAASKAVER